MDEQYNELSMVTSFEEFLLWVYKYFEPDLNKSEGYFSLFKYLNSTPLIFEDLDILVNVINYCKELTKILNSPFVEEDFTQLNPSFMLNLMDKVDGTIPINYINEFPSNMIRIPQGSNQFIFDISERHANLPLIIQELDCTNKNWATSIQLNGEKCKVHFPYLPTKELIINTEECIFEVYSRNSGYGRGILPNIILTENVKKCSMRTMTAESCQTLIKNGFSGQTFKIQNPNTLINNTLFMVLEKVYHSHQGILGGHF